MRIVFGYCGLIVLLFYQRCLLAKEIDSLISLSLTELINIEITTTSKYKELVTDSPANIYVFSRSQILARGYKNIEDILQALPNVHVQKYAITGHDNVISFRGVVGNNNFLILQDGIRISSPAGELTPINENFPIYYAKQVEVVMGPSSVVYGADAYMGVINIITMNENEKPLGEVAVSAGSEGYHYFYEHMHQNFANNSFINIGLQTHESQHWQFHRDFPELYTDASKQYAFAPRKQYHFYINSKIKERWTFGLNHAYQENSLDFTARPSSSNFDEDSKLHTLLTTVYGRFDTAISKKLMSHTVVTFINYEIDNNTYFNNAFSGFEKGYKYANTERVSFNQDFKYSINDTHILSSGIVFEKFSVIPQGPDLPAPYNENKNPGAQQLFYPNTSLPIEFFETRYENTGLYVQDNWRISKNSRVIAGVRYDHNTFYGDTTNPRVSWIFSVNDHNIIKLLYGHAFLAPSTNRAFVSFGTFSGAQNADGEWLSSPNSRFRVPNLNLKPEKLQTLELTYEHWFDNTSLIKAAPYYTQIRDSIQLKADAQPDQAIPGAELLSTNKFINLGEAKILGLEIGIENQTGIGAIVYKSWAYYGFLDGMIESEGKSIDLPMTAQHKITAGTEIHVANRYTITPIVYWIGKTNSNQPDPADSEAKLKVPAYFILDLHTDTSINTELQLKLDIKNVLDEKYSNAPFPPAFGSLNEAPQPGRLIYISLHYRI